MLFRSKNEFDNFVMLYIIRMFKITYEGKCVFKKTLFFGDFRCGALLFMVIHVIY